MDHSSFADWVVPSSNPVCLAIFWGTQFANFAKRFEKTNFSSFLVDDLDFEEQMDHARRSKKGGEEAEILIPISMDEERIGWQEVKRDQSGNQPGEVEVYLKKINLVQQNVYLI